jgi:outer membrane protein assembly factor BamB
MIRDPRFRTPDGDLAFRLGRYVDALVTEADTMPVAAPEIAELAAIARALADAPRDPAPAELHERARARLATSPRWVKLVATRPHDGASVMVVPNGYEAGMAGTDDRAPDAPITPLRRLVPSGERAAVAVAILVLLYIAFGRDRQANEPMATMTPAATEAPTATAAAPTPTGVAGAVGDCPMLGCAPTRSGGADRAIPASAPPLRWTAALPAGIKFPVAAGDAVYTSNGGVIVALDAATGAVRWQFDLGVAPSVAGAKPPAVLGGIVYAAGHDGTVFAIDAATGQLRWSHETGGTVSTAVAVDTDTVFVGTNEGTLFALDAATGENRWAYPTGAISVSSPVIAEGVIYVGGGGDTLFALDTTNGLPRWKKSVKAGMQSVAVGDGLAVAAGINTSNAVLLVAMDAANGDALWQDQSGAELPPAIVDGTVYAPIGEGVVALDGKRGTRRWVFNATLRVVDITVLGDAILLCRKDGKAIAVNTATGKEVWNVATGGTATGVAVGAGVVYVAHSDGTLAAYG